MLSNSDHSNEPTFTGFAEKSWRRMIEILRLSREANGWSCEELAGRIEVVPSSVLTAENGDTVPTVVFVFRWCHVLGVDPGELFKEGSLASGSIKEEP